MRKVILIMGLMMISSAAMAADVQIFKNASISTCGTNAEGCAASLTTSTGASYLVDQNYAQSFLKKNDHLNALTGKNISVSEVMGVVVKESGHFPNPTVEFSVVKIISIVE